jgi:HSP20 family protein
MAQQGRGTEMATYRPERDIDRIFDEIEETFENVFGRPFYPVAYSREPEVRAWSPPMEIYDTDGTFTMRMELPGVKMEDIDITAAGDSVTIKGERKEPEGAHEESYLLCERCYGTFERTITFPSEIDLDNIRANYNNGILELTVP